MNQSQGRITLESPTEDRWLPDRKELVLLPRYLFDFVGLILSLVNISWLHILQEVKFTIAQYCLARPFHACRRFVLEVPDELPQDLLMSNHHIQHGLENEYQAMFFVGQMQSRFRVIQAAMGANFFTEKIQGGSQMKCDNPHWLIASKFRQGQLDSRFLHDPHRSCLVVFPDRVGPLHDHDDQIAYGYGIHALSLASQLPILDCMVYQHKDDLSDTVYIRYEFRQPPQVERLEEWTPETQDSFRKQHKKLIQEYSCHCKNLQTQFLQKAYTKPMCSNAQGLCPRQPLFAERQFLNKIMREKYSCETKP